MSEATEETWMSTRPKSKQTEEGLQAEEILVLRDRVIGLEQAVIECSGRSLLDPSETIAVELTLMEIRSSLTWRLGRMAMVPYRGLRAVKRALIR